MTAVGDDGEPRILLTVAHDSGMSERVIGVLDSLGLTGWTQMFGAHGLGGAGRKQDNPIWPGSVTMLFIVLPEADVPRVASALRELQRSYAHNPGLTMWCSPVELL
jgi:hypothetical protein